MLKFVLWLLLFIICWPLAIAALFIYPILWIILLPFRLLGIAVDGILDLISALLKFPARILRGPSSL